MKKGQASLRKGRVSLDNQIYHISTSTIERKPLFLDFRFGRIVVDCLRHESNLGRTETLAYVVMPDHLHWLFALTPGHSLSECVKNVKSNSARKINRLHNQGGRIWTSAFYDRAIRRNEDLPAVARYIVANPLRACLVQTIREYPLWDAKWV